MRCMSPQSATTKPAPALGTSAAHREPEARRAVEQRRIVREREVGLRHAHGQRTEPQRVHPRQVLLGLRKEVDAVGAVELDGDRLDLRPQRRAVGREEPEVVRLLARLTTAFARSTAPSPPSANPRFTTTLSAPASTASRSISSTSASVSVGKLLIETTHGRPYACTMLMCAARLSAPRRSASRSSFAELRERHAAVGLRGAHRGDEHGRARREAPRPAHDVAELLEAQVAREPRLGHDVVGELQRHPVLDDRVVRVRDVAERPGVDQRRLSLERLHQVRLERVLHDHGHRAGRPGGPRRSPGSPPRSSATTIRPSRARRSCEVARQREHRHDLGRRGDDELVLARDAVDPAAQADDRVAQFAVVHVQRPRPRDRRGSMSSGFPL